MLSTRFAVVGAASVLLAAATTANAQRPPLLDEPVIAAIAAETSGERAHQIVEAISLHHRTRGSRPLRAAVDLILERAKAAGLEDAHVNEFRADGKVFYGTQRSRPPWNAEFAELWEMRQQGSGLVPSVRLASWDAQPMSLAQDSENGDATAELIDVGAGTAESDYAGKEVRGKIVLAGSQPGPVARLAVARRGAVGIVSYAQNQRSAWWGEDETLIRWGHLETFDEPKTFAFMISPGVARSYRDRLARGERITVRARVRAGKKAGNYDIATAMIRGADPRLSQEEIVYSCHLDHPRPGANDNASGCATILEVARTLSKLIAEKRLEPPRRTIRFVWPPEIEGTLALLNGRPEIASCIKAAIHLDMVGGGPETKAIFHVTRGPASQPSFVHDVSATVGMFVNEQTADYAMTGTAKWPLVAPTGGKEPLRAALVPLTLGSDHQVYGDSSFGIPAIYLNDWPDRYIHTNFDLPAHIDPTKLGRAAFIAGVTGYVLSRISNPDVPALNDMLDAFALERRATAMRRKDANVLNFAEWYEREAKASIARFVEQSLLSAPDRTEKS